MITAEVGDITKISVEAVVNAANGIGIMGAGVAGALRRTGGVEVEEEAKEACKKRGNVQSGGYYRTGSGKLKNNGVKYIYHAVTMSFPGGLTSLYYVQQAFEGVLSLAVSDEIKSIAVTGLGIGIGGLDARSVASIMYDVAKQNKDIDIKFVDINESFINTINDFLNKDTI